MRYYEVRVLRIPLTALVCLALLMTSCSTCRIVGEAADPAYSELVPGERIRINRVDETAVVGVFESTSDDTLFCQFRCVPLGHVESIERCEFDIRKTVLQSVGTALLLGLAWWGLSSIDWNWEDALHWSAP